MSDEDTELFGAPQQLPVTEAPRRPGPHDRDDCPCEHPFGTREACAVCNCACTEECVAIQECTVCRRRKAPSGRSVPMEMGSMLCDWECSGYLLDPQAGHLWPGEDVAP